MKNNRILVGTAVMPLAVGDVSFNARKIKEVILEEKKATLLVFPELSLTGYTCGDLFQQDALLDEAAASLLQLAEATKGKEGFTAVVGLPLRFQNGLYNTAAFLSGGKVCGIVPKSNIPNYSEFYEERWFLSGKDIRSQHVLLGKEEVPFGTDLLFEDSKSSAVIGAEICEDLWVPDAPSNHMAIGGANILVNLSASDEIIGKADYRRSLVVLQSAKLYSAYLYVSSGTSESSTDLVFSGHSLIAQNGRLLAETNFPKESPCVTRALISLSESEHDRRHQNTFGAYDSSYVRVPVAVSPFGGYEPTVDDFASRMKKDGFAVDPFPFVPKDENELRKRAESILSIQANGLVTRVRKTGLKNLVIGVSGGLDSTLALLVMAEARKIEPSIKILGYTLPSKGATSSRTKKNAIALMKALSVDEIHEVPIGVTVKKHLQDIGHPLAYEGEKDTCYENAQARMRTYILMDIANMRQGLVVGTGDLSELALGWCTYNGDHMSMYGVNCSIPKTLVKYLVKAYSQFAKDRKLEEILLSIIDTPITPELVPTSKDTIEQKTEEVIGKYDLNDFYLFHTLRYGEDPATVLALSLVAYPALSKEESKKALKNFYLRFYHSQFKRSCLPDGPKVGSLSLSPRGDWRMPSDASPDMVLSLLDKA